MPEKSLGDDPVYETVLVDAMNLCARHDWRELSHRGEWTGMLYGVMQNLIGFRYNYPRASVAMLWDGEGSWREQVSPFYKSSRVDRRKRDEHRDFLKRASKVRGWVLDLGVVNAEADDWEADDLASFFSVYTEHRPVLLVSQDRDWFQLLADDVHIQCGNKIHTTEDADDFLGYPYAKSILWKTIKGCRTDDIPGIPRFPTKLALEAVRVCDSFAEVVRWLDENGYRKWAEKAREHNADEIWNLVSLDADRVPYNDIRIERGEFDYANLERLFQHYALQSLIPLLQSLDGALAR